MAITFPLANLFDKFGEGTTPFELDHRQEIAREAGGTSRTAIIGPPLWKAHLESIELTIVQATALQAKINSLDESGQTFYQYPPIGQYPSSDPLGVHAGLLAASPVLAEVNTASNLLNFGGLPVNFVMQAGDYFSFVYNTSVRAFHQLTEGAVVNGIGQTGQIGLRPRLRPTATVSTAVVFRRPTAEMMIVPKSTRIRMIGALYAVVSCDVTQVI